MTPAEKRALLRETALRHGLRVFVETGTYDGATALAMVTEPAAVDAVYTVEKSADLYATASIRTRFDGRIHCFHGDSAEWMRVALLATIREPALFWLDAHAGEPGTAGTYGECPLRDEIAYALYHGRAMRLEHVILVDDVRLMVEDGWPRLHEVERMAEAHGYTCVVEDDIARMVIR